jgi:putative membrane protein insertion efficiency factor
MSPMPEPLTILRRTLILLIEFLVRGYQVILSPLLIGSCKFVPSCSEYAIQAVREWGPIRGGWLAVKRIVRCNPFTIGGIDPVPERDTK